MKKKTIKKIVITILVVLASVLAFGVYNIRKILYPSVLKTGNGQTKVLCVGDSITFSQGVLKTRNTDSYPAILANLLGSDYQTLNYGLPNRTLQSTGNMPYFDEKLAKESFTVDAQILIFMLGSNDTKPVNWDADRYMKEYKEALANYQQMESNPKIYVMIPPRIFLDSEDEKDCSNAILEENLLHMIPEIAAEAGVEVIDLYSVTKDHPEWFADGLHPNKEGNQAIAEEIYSVISTTSNQ